MLIQRKTRSIRYQWNIISQGFKLKLLRFTLHRRFLVGTPKPALCRRPAEVQAVASVAPHSTTSHLRHRMIMNHEGRFCSCIAVFVIEVRRDTSFSFHWKLSRQNYDVTFLVWSWLLEKKTAPSPPSWRTLESFFCSWGGRIPAGGRVNQPQPTSQVQRSTWPGRTCMG